MATFTSAQLDSLPRFYRGNLINGLTGSKPALLIGTVSKSGTTNLALFSNVIHLGANPALIGLLQRPLTEQSHTYRNITEAGVFTVSHIKNDWTERAHQTSAKYAEGESEFLYCGFQEEYREGFPAPHIKGSSIALGARFIREILLEENGTRLLIASVEWLHVDDDVLLSDGNIDLEKAESMAAGGLERYYGLRFKKQLPYAKRPSDLP